MLVWNATKTVLKYTSPVAWLIAEGVEKAATSVASASDKGMGELEEEVAKQTLQMQFAQQQARIEQELAIARRIDNAEEVEIEEFYDTSGKGNIGISVDQTTQSASFGAGAEGHRVTKRVYHFKGWRSDSSDE